MMQLDEMSQYAEMEDLLIYTFLEIPVKIENAWNVKFILCLLEYRNTQNVGSMKSDTYR